MMRGEEVTLHLDTAAFEGKAVGRLDNLVVFVQGGVPGDTVTARLRKIKRTFLEADVVSVLQPSPERVEPPCRYFGICGGCKWQQLAYEAQCRSKRQHVVDALERIGGFDSPDVRECLPSPSQYYYRNKMEFSFGDRWLTREEMAIEDVSRFALGLHIPERFDRVLDLHDCRLQSEASVQIVNATRQFALSHRIPIYSTRTHTGYLRNLVIRESRRTGERMVNLVTFEHRPDLMETYRSEILAACPDITTIVNNVNERKSQVAVGDFEFVYHGPGTILEYLGSRQYRISANSFFQTNTAQAERLYDTVQHMAALTGQETVYDLYCGTGTIALHLAGNARAVIGVESVVQAVDDARKNAEGNGVGNCEFIAGDLKDVLTKGSSVLAGHPPPDVIVVDPPRSGMHAAVVGKLCEIGAPRIVYVSCNPATQARDLKLLADQGGYRVRVSQPVDMFPHTYHIENVTLVERG